MPDPVFLATATEIVLRAGEDGSLVRLSDVAEVAADAESYAFSTYLNGMPSAAIGAQPYAAPRKRYVHSSESLRLSQNTIGIDDQRT